MAIADENECRKQAQLVKDLLNKQLNTGDAWYLIDARWYKQWKEFVCFDKCNEDNISSMDLRPGLIYNSKILDGNQELKPGLVEGSDFFLLPKEAWLYLKKFYGLEQGCKDIERYVIASGEKNYMAIEIYLYKMKIYLNKITEVARTYSCSVNQSMAEVFSDLKVLMSCPADREVRLIGCYSNAGQSKTYVGLSTAADHTVSKVGLHRNMIIIVEVKSTDNIWPTLYNQTNGIAVSATTEHADRRKILPGICGLNNLGNTCFMNSALQCLSNIPQLTNYFVGSSDRWTKDLNRDNPLGMSGKVAASYNNLINEMWSGRKNDIIPKEFKYTVGMYAPIFNGYNQQDCHELMAFVLDGLHEDLNRIRSKPYIEEKDSNNRPDEVVANESWDNYKLRNDSIVVDTFHGLLKSTLVCLKCSHLAVKFDPFCFLSLPCPDVVEKQVVVVFYFLDPKKSLSRIKINLKKDSCVNDVFIKMEQITGVLSTHMIAKEVYHFKCTRILQPQSGINEIAQHEDIYIYQTKSPAGVKPERARLITFDFLCESSQKNKTSYEEFMNQMILEIPDDHFTYEHIYKTILNIMSVRMINKYGLEYVKALEKENENNWQSTDDDMEVDSDNDNTPTPKKPHNKATSHNNSNSNNKSPSSLFTVLLQGKILSQINLDGKSLHEYYLQFSNNFKSSIIFTRDFRERFLIDREMQAIVEMEIPKQIKNESRVGLFDCIDLFTTREQLSEKDPWYCPTCKQLQQATKKFDLWKLPNILLFQLKRFRSQGMWRNKIDSHIDFPTKDLDMSCVTLGNSEDDKYDLIAVANHSGSLNGGHYTAKALNQHTGLWYDFNDSCCWQIDEERVVTKQAYILVYQRQQRK